MYIDALNDAIHTSAKEAGCIPSRQFTPKPYWCQNYRLYGTGSDFGGDCGFRMIVQDGDGSSSVGKDSKSFLEKSVDGTAIMSPGQS